MHDNDNRKLNISREDLTTPGFLKAVLIVMLILFLVIVYNRADANDVPMSRIDSQLRSKTDIEQMEKCSSRDLMHFIGLDASDYDGFIYYKSKEALGVDEVLIIKAKREDQLDGVRDAVDKRVDDQIAAFESYGPQQVKLLENSVVRIKGKYVFYCTAKDPNKYEEVWLDVI
jgi:hypothetical protein